MTLNVVLQYSVQCMWSYSTVYNVCGPIVQCTMYVVLQYSVQCMWSYSTVYNVCGPTVQCIMCKERSQPVGTDSSRHNIIISTPNTNQWSLFIVTLQTTLMDRQSAHLMTRVQRLLTCAVTDYYTTPSSRRSVSIGWSSCSLGIPVLYFCRLISMGSLIFCRFFMW